LQKAILQGWLFVFRLTYSGFVNYRHYAPADFEQLYAIEEICFQPPLRFSRRYMRGLLGSEKSSTWIAEEDGRMAGFAVVDWTREAGGAVAYIQTIEVTPEWRGQGVGGELLRRAEGSARLAGAGEIWLHVDAENRAAIGLYQANGYFCEGKQDGYYGRGRAALIFKKELVVT
jgi:ribosomal protein S18 acetylase RimI-like enzyme